MAKKVKENETEIVMPEILETANEEIVVEENETKENIGIATTCVNIRKTPDIESEIVGVLYSGSSIKITGAKKTSGFYKVEGGYVMADYLTIKEN